MAETFRIGKLEKFISKKVTYMENQQRVIEYSKLKGHPIDPIEYNQIATYNLISELCQEFGIEMPHVLGVTPKTSSY